MRAAPDHDRLITPDEGAATAPSRRERSKDGRRARILGAAVDILREAGIDDLTMRVVAERAGVSPTTVYNLFGSKRAVLAAVFDADLARFEAIVAQAPSRDALARLLDSVDVAMGLYHADPAFYRAILWRRPNAASDLALGTAMHEPRTRFYRRMIDAIAAEGLLRPCTDTGLLGALASHMMFGLIADWIDDLTPLERLGTDMKRGLAVVLLGFATAPAAARLHAVLAGTPAAGD